MRIIAGRLKGRQIGVPTWPGLRPTADKLRETLFNVLQHEVGGAMVLDGFAGTGAVGLEALSRGAAHVTFVEQDRRACALIAENLRRCGVAEGYTIERADVVSRLARLTTAFDIVFVDPPYDEPDLAAIVAAGLERVAPDGVLVLEHASRRAAPGTGETLDRTAPARVLKSGDSALAFYQRLQPGSHR